MFEIRPLIQFDAAQFQETATGYVSNARYVVRKSESDARAAITLELEELKTPYTKTWDYGEEDWARYRQVVERGFSLGMYDGDLLIALAIAEAVQWNRSFWVWEFHVAPSHQGRGAGGQLMEALAEKAAQAGMRVMVCETQNTNLPAIRFYRQAGFEIGGLDLSYYSNQDVEEGEVAIFMKRKL